VRIDPGASGSSEVVGSISQGLNGARYSDYQVAATDAYVWVSNDAGALNRYDLNSKVVDVFYPGVASRGLAAHLGDVWLTACGTPGTVLRIDPRSGAITATIAAGGAKCLTSDRSLRVVSIAAGPEGVWVTDNVNGTVSQIRLVDNSVLAPIRVGESPTGLALGLGSVWVIVDGEEVAPSPSPSAS
jgi:hypothetical protein